MGRDRTVPRQLGRVNSRFRTPVAGLVVMGVIPVLALVLYLASASLQKTIVYIDSTGGLLFAGYYVVISLYSIWYYRSVLLRDAREFVLGLLLPLVGAGTRAPGTWRLGAGRMGAGRVGQVMLVKWIQRRMHSAKKASRSAGASPTTLCSWP